jgi:oligoendopeptidase F
MELFFGKNANKYRYAHLEDAVRFLPYGATVDEFQHWVYEHPTATPEQRDEQWRLIDNKYRPYMDYKASSFYSKGHRWLLQSHIFTSPLYYIDYTLAQVASFQFLAESQKNFQKAWKKYVRYAKLGGRYPFVSLLEHAHIRVPFEAGNVKKAINPVKKILKSFDSKEL